MRAVIVVSIMLFLTACGLMFSRRDQRAEIMTAVALSGVRIEVEDGEGSGTVIARKGNAFLILTCEHVLGEGPEVTVKTFAGKVRGFVDKRDAANDLATVVAYDLIGVDALPVATKEPALYQTLYAVTSPLGIPLVGSEGILYSKGRDLMEGTKRWGFTGFIMPGSSGGTITNAQGQLVCVAEAVVASSRFDIVPELGYCVGLQAIHEFLQGYLV